MKILASGALTALAMGAPIMAEAQTANVPLLAGTRLDVSAHGEVRRVPDIAVISAGWSRKPSQRARRCKTMQGGCRGFWPL